MTRKECLDKAAECVLKDRQNVYGKPEDCFGVIANFWSVYLGRKVYPHDVAMMMALLKVARIKANRGYADGYVDLAGYAACGAECADALKAREDAVHETGEECRRLREQEPEFKPGDKVQVRMPAADGDRWDDAVCVSVLPEGTGLRVDCGDYRAVAFGWHNIRHAPKAEGCEELVEKDAPQTPAELYDRIIANNPATYGSPHTPTGEELAEMAEEAEGD